MRKLVWRMISFIAFMFACSIAGIGIFAISSGWIQLPGVALPETPDVGIAVPSFGGQDGNFDINPQLIEEAKNRLPPDIQAQLESGEMVILAEEVERRELVSSIPAPQQIVIEPKVVGNNIFLAILMALIFGGISTVMGNMLHDEEYRIQEWLRAFKISKLVDWVKTLFNWTLGGRIKQGCLTLPFIALIIATYGIIFAFLEGGTSILSKEGIFLAVGMAFSVGVVSFSGDLVRRFFARIWGIKSKFNLYPANLFVAVITVIFSRLLGILPGVAFGSPGGADVDLPAATAERRERILSLASLLVLAALAIIGWGISGWMLTILDNPYDARVASTLAGIITPVQNTALMLFLVALETLFFEMLPLAYGMAQPIFKWNKFLWGILFVPVAFLFNHTLLNPQSGFLESFQTANVRLLWFMIFAMLGSTALMWFYFNIVDDILKSWVRKRPR